MTIEEKDGPLPKGPIVVPVTPFVSARQKRLKQENLKKTIMILQLVLQHIALYLWQEKG